MSTLDFVIIVTGISFIVVCVFFYISAMIDRLEKDIRFKMSSIYQKIADLNSINVVKLCQIEGKMSIVSIFANYLRKMNNEESSDRCNNPVRGRDGNRWKQYYELGDVVICDKDSENGDSYISIVTKVDAKNKKYSVSPVAARINHNVWCMSEIKVTMPYSNILRLASEDEKKWYFDCTVEFFSAMKK